MHKALPADQIDRPLWAIEKRRRSRETELTKSLRTKSGNMHQKGIGEKKRGALFPIDLADLPDSAVGGRGKPRNTAWKGP